MAKHSRGTKKARGDAGPDPAAVLRAKYNALLEEQAHVRMAQVALATVMEMTGWDAAHCNELLGANVFSPAPQPAEEGNHDNPE